MRVTDKDQLQQEFERLVQTLVKPWESKLQVPKTRLFKLFWTAHLDNLEKLRTKAYKVWKHSRTDQNREHANSSTSRFKEERGKQKPGAMNTS